MPREDASVASMKQNEKACARTKEVSVSLEEVSDEKASNDLHPVGETVCSICSVAAVSKCQRCLSIVYCGKECQQRGWSGLNSHRKICAQIKKAKQKVEEEAERLKTFKRLKNKKVKKPKDCDYKIEDLFETSVGKFWEIKEARSYCESRNELALALRECGAQNKSKLAVEIALDHLLDLLKLTGGDPMKGFRSSVPSLLLYLDKDQEAYNFIKWGMKSKEIKNEWNFTNFRDLKHEEVTEDLQWRDLTTHQVVDICLVKIKAKFRLEKEIGHGFTLRDMDQQIGVLFSLLKEVNELLWKFICDPDVMERKCSQELEENPMVFIDPKGDMKEALEVKRNVSFAWKNDPNVQELVRKFVGTKETLADASKNSDWATNLGIKKYSWLVDCYRLRLDDDYAWGGCNLHGLYEDSSPGNIAQDFMVFCALAARRGLLPMIWDWNLFLKEASKNLNYAFEKSDAQEDWGMLGPMLLRTTADQIYGGGPNMFESDSLQDKVQDEVDNESDLIFKDIGGVKNWFKLVNWLEQ